MNNNIEFVYVKAKIDSNLNEAFKKVLTKLNISQQDFIEREITNFIIKNVNVILEKDNKGSAVAK